MIAKETIAELKKRMLERRKEILDSRDSLNNSWRNLRERASEQEEMAEKENLSENLELLDHRLYTELENIDQALADIETGVYGRCISCFRPIAAKRLKAVPWARQCRQCARHHESGSDREADVSEETGERLSDARIVDTVWDELDKRVSEEVTENLEVRSDAGTVYLSGTVPTEKEHQLVLEIIEEDLGFDDVIDRIDLDELERREYDELAEGESPQEDPYEAMEDNTSMIPPDEPAPEDERGSVPE